MNTVMSCKKHGDVPFRADYQGRMRCVKCSSGYVQAQRRKKKQILVDEAGGKCSQCGYDRCLAALHFHHVEPAEKCFSLSNVNFASSLVKLRVEASKCVLLCANCHAEVEHGVVPER